MALLPCTERGFECRQSDSRALGSPNSHPLLLPPGPLSPTPQPPGLLTPHADAKPAPLGSQDGGEMRASSMSVQLSPQTPVFTPPPPQVSQERARSRIGAGAQARGALPSPLAQPTPRGGHLLRPSCVVCLQSPASGQDLDTSKSPGAGLLTSPPCVHLPERASIIWRLGGGMEGWAPPPRIDKSSQRGSWQLGKAGPSEGLRCLLKILALLVPGAGCGLGVDVYAGKPRDQARAP